jgi:hypothetical protein
VNEAQSNRDAPNALRERVEQVLYAVQNDTWDLIPREPEGRFHLGTAAVLASLDLNDFHSATKRAQELMGEFGDEMTERLLVASYGASAGYRGFQ